MQIKRLLIAGFKSFVDPVDLRIEPGLTGIVGPNGCGKSNLLEALRWTMGEGSARSLRGAGMDDVIFAGTATRPPRNVAEVAILAEIADPDSTRETEVTRRIERGAGSAYRIDGQDVRAKDVALLFADAATGAHSPALVSQGRIGAVIAARPADRRAMLEEAAGIAGLHVRRHDAEQKLRATEANLARLDDVIADQDARIAVLRRQARTADRYRAIGDRIRIAEARLVYARWRDAVAAADAAKAGAEAAQDAVTIAAAAERAAAADRQSAVERIATTRATALAARDRASETGHRLTTLRADRAALTRRVAELAEARHRIEADRARECALASAATEALARLARDIALLDPAIAAATARIAHLDQTLGDAEAALRDAEVALAHATARQAAEAAERRVAAAALTAAQARAARVGREADAVAAAIATLGDVAPLDAARQDAAARREVALAGLAEARGALDAAERDERDGIARRDAADRARAAARATLAALESEAAALTRATRREGRDRLLDHLTPAPGYERALAAALGDDLAIALAAWRGAAPSPADPPAPRDAAPLGDHVEAPEKLTRRLAQVFVGEDRGQTLAVGQRLVTRNGRLRRWDGFVASEAGAASAERLERLNRLKALAAARPNARTDVAATEAAFDAIETAILAARQTAATARTAASQAEEAARIARQDGDRAITTLDRLAGQRADLAERAGRAKAERAEAEAELKRARAIGTALPDDRATDAMLASLMRAADAHRRRVADLRDERGARARAATADREKRAAMTAETQGWRARADEAATRIAATAAREAQLAIEAGAVAARPDEIDDAIARLATEHDDARTHAAAVAEAERRADAALQDAERVHRAASETLASAREVRAGAGARVENQEARRIEMGRVSGERFECPAPVLPGRLGFEAASVGAPGDESAAHDRLLAERERIGPVNLVAARELADIEAAGIGSADERRDLGLAVARLRASIATLNREGRQRLLAAFEAVNGHFRRLFATLFDGGQAHLDLIDADDPLDAGLEIMAQPPGKRLQSLTLLSGGEQALTAVALIFALFLTNPAPICVLDEVDAPLDDANIERFCALLDRMTRETDTRYLIVTHNAVTMSRMHRLFGVTMIEKGVSRLVSVDLRAAELLVATP